MKTLAKVAMLSIMLSTSVYIEATEKIPMGWIKGGTNSTAYKVGVDNKVVYVGKQSAYIESSPQNTNMVGTGALYQSVYVDEYRGQRVRFSVFIKSENIDGMGGVWFQTHADDKAPLDFVNSSEAPISGTQEWTKTTVELDIAEHVDYMTFGTFLQGNGKVWFDEVSLELVRPKVVSNITPTNTTSLPINQGANNE